MNYMISKVCRIAAESVKAIAEAVELKPGLNPIPETALAPRQIRLGKAEGGIAATLKWHRDGYIAAVRPEVAKELVRDGAAEFCPQWLLCCAVQEYLADPDVREDPAETAKAEKLPPDALVVVAVVGEGRSPHRVCANVVNGCQNPETLVADAKAALDAASVFLIED